MAGEKIVGGDGAAERQLQVGVDIDTARQDQLARGIDRLAIGLEAATDQSHLLSFDQDVRSHRIASRNNRAIIDQRRHRSHS